MTHTTFYAQVSASHDDKFTSWLNRKNAVIKVRESSNGLIRLHFKTQELFRSSNLKQSLSTALEVPLSQVTLRLSNFKDVVEPASQIETPSKAVQSDVAHETINKLQQAIHHLIHVMHDVNIDSKAMLTMLKAQLREGKAVKTSVPRNVKIAVWNRWIGEERGKAPCWCCGVASLDKGIGWHCGHVVAEVEGGESDVSNLRPVCAGCNMGMGTQNMLGYMQRHYRDRFAQTQ